MAGPMGPVPTLVEFLVGRDLETAPALRCAVLAHCLATSTLPAPYWATILNAVGTTPVCENVVVEAVSTFKDDPDVAEWVELACKNINMPLSTRLRLCTQMSVPFHEFSAASAALLSSAPESVERLDSPSDFDSCKCLGRVWNGGAGGQCHRERQDGTDFCVMHNKEALWRIHGRVDGPIPESKLREFLKASNKTPKAPTSAARPSSKKRNLEKAAENSTASPEVPKLKRPHGGAYGIFLSESGDAIQEASVRWRALPEEEKKVLKDRYKAMGAEYKAAPRKMKMKKEKEVLRAPDGEKLKRPCFGAFGVFMEETRESIKASLPPDANKMTDVGKQAGALWKVMTEDEKKAFKAKSEDKMATYNMAKRLAQDAAKASKALVSQAAHSDAPSAALGED